MLPEELVVTKDKMLPEEFVVVGAAVVGLTKIRIVQ